MKFGPILGSVVLAACSLAATQASAVNFTLNTSSTATISPYIYGVNWSIGNYTNAPFYRTGGNRITAYNWTNNNSNAGSDWYFENDGMYSSSTTAGAGMASAITPALNANGGILVSVPINGYVSKDRNGGNADVRYLPGTSTFDPNWLTARFVPEQAAKPGGPGSFTLNPSPTSTVVYQDEFVNWVKTNYPAGFTTNSTTPIWFALDNETDLWAYTHAELRPVVAGSVTAQKPLGTPTPVTYAEMIQKTTAYAAAIKAVAPNTKIFGPASYGWNGYTTLQGAPDSGTDGDWLTYYLNQMAAASQTAGKRLVDVLDLHWYPEVSANNIRITTGDSSYSGSTLAALQAARIQAPRSLWDPTYTESSWITNSGSGPIQLLPREQAKMTAAATTYGSAYAANQISISEYDYGGGDDISGGIAQADVLGIFGQQHVLSANVWPESSSAFYVGAFQMYRNYDGKGSTFGDISVTVGGNSTNAANASLYASEYSTDSSRMALVAINKTTGSLTAALPLPTAPNGKAFTVAAVYALTAASSTPQFVDELFISNPVNFSYTMPGYSVNTIALTTPTAGVWSTAVSGNWSSTGKWTGTLPNASGTVAAINASTTTGRTITLDAPETVGWLFLGNAGKSTVGYTLSGTGSNTLTFNNAGSGAVLAVSDGTHAINAPVVLADDLLLCGSNTGWTLSFGTTSVISGGYGLNMSGNGTVILSGSDTYTGVTTFTSGVVNVGAAENAGTSGPLGKSAAANPGSIVFSGGTLQYSAVNQRDYSGRFSTAANQAYSVDTNSQNVTWATALTSPGGSLAKLGNGTLTLTAATTNLATASVSGGGLAISGGTFGTLNFNSGAGASTIGAGTVTTINVNAGGLAISGGTIGTSNYNAATGTNTISAGTVTTVNVTAGGVAINGGTIGAFNHNSGAGISTIGVGAAVSALNVNSGTVNFNSTQANGALTLPAGSTGTVIVGPATGGLLPTVATADFSGTPATGTVNAAHPLAITSTLKLPGGLSAIISNGASFTATGANLANTSTPSTLSLSGGTLNFPTGAGSQSIGVHWAGYGNNTTTPVSGTDGVVPQGNWSNVATSWYGGSASNLVNSSGTATAAAVTCAGNGAGTYWWSPPPATNVDNLVLGPEGTGAIMNAITGIPFSNYEIIAYVNDYQAAGSQFSVWLDGNAAGSNQSNAPLAGSRYYYGATYNNPVGFVQISNNSNASTYNNANYVIWTGLSGPIQTLWTQGWSSGGASGNNNEGITSFQIVSTTGPANVNLLATAISVTSGSTLDLGETGTPSQYHTFSGLSLTAGSAGGTQLQLQHGLNINFNGISATYPTGGIGAKTASIVNGTASPVISLASGSSVNVDPNVTLTIGSAIGDPQTGATALTKTGTGTLTLTSSNTYSGGTTINAGILAISADTNLGKSTGALAINNGTLDVTTGFTTSRSITLGTGQPTIQVDAGTLSFSTLITASGRLTKTGPGVLQLLAGSSNNIVETLSGLTISAGAFDLTNHDLLVTHGAASGLSAYRGKITTSFTPASANAGTATAAIALVTGTEYNALFGTSTLNSDDLYGKFTYAGDANLDGKITVDDYMALDLGYLFGLRGWTHGDFAQTGLTITAADYAIIDNSYLHQSGKLADGEIALHEQWFGQAYADAFNALSVPEPASLALLALGGGGLLRRKRRK